MKENKIRMIFTILMAITLIGAVSAGGYMILNTDRLYTPVENKGENSEAESSAKDVLSEDDLQESEEKDDSFFEPAESAYSEDTTVNSKTSDESRTESSEPAESETESEEEISDVPVINYAVTAGVSGQISDIIPSELKDSFYRCEISDFEGTALTVESDGYYQTFGKGKTTVDIYDGNNELIAKVIVSVSSDGSDDETQEFSIAERDIKLEVKEVIEYLSKNGIAYDRNMDRNIFDFAQDDSLTETADVKFITISAESGIDTVEELKNELREYASSAIGNYKKFNCVYQKQNDSSYTVALLFA